MTRDDLKNWQKDYRNIKTDRVQFWHNGIMLHLMLKDDAQWLVHRGKCFVITEQAIGNILESGALCS